LRLLLRALGNCQRLGGFISVKRSFITSILGPTVGG
jgi:hypothetical protein